MNLGLMVLVPVLFCVHVYTENYDGYKIYEVIPTNEKQCKFLYNLSKTGKDLDFLTLSSVPKYPARVLVSPEEQSKFVKSLHKHKISFKIINNNVAETIKEQQVLTARTGLKAGTVTFKRYMHHKEINEYLDALENRYPNLVSVQVVGKSFQGRVMKTITITEGRNIGRKSIIIIDAGVHGREWIAPASALYAIYQLVEHHEKYSDLLKKVAFVILPLANPDGYEFSHKKNRFWRKTMKPNYKCVGVDINRNTDIEWGKIDSSTDPCEENYQGNKPFSETESQILKLIMLSYTGRTKMYLSLHSYGSFIFHPYAYTEKTVKNRKLQREIGKAGADAILKSTRRDYAVGAPSKLLYAASGGTLDYAYIRHDIPVSLIMELPAAGSGFDPENYKIKKLVSETWTGILAMLEKLAEKFEKKTKVLNEV